MMAPEKIGEIMVIDSREISRTTIDSQKSREFFPSNYWNLWDSRELLSLIPDVIDVIKGTIAHSANGPWKKKFERLIFPTKICNPKKFKV